MLSNIDSNISDLNEIQLDSGDIVFHKEKLTKHIVMGYKAKSIKGVQNIVMTGVNGEETLTTDNIIPYIEQSRLLYDKVK